MCRRRRRRRRERLERIASTVIIIIIRYTRRETCCAQSREKKKKINKVDLNGVCDRNVERKYGGGLGGWSIFSYGYRLAARVVRRSERFHRFDT